ncbi:MAG: hypothetical protein V1808_04740 [Candidatus Daviesbacteria bacterium]
MSDGIKGAVADVNEAVVKPVVDEVGKAIEEGVQSVVSGPPKASPQDPATQQTKQAEETKKKAWATHVIDWYKKIDEEQAKVRQAKQQELTQKQQEEQQKKEVKQFESLQQEKKKEQLTAVQLAARATEIKRGVGG